MGKIPEFTRTVLPQTAQYGLVDVARQAGASEAAQHRQNAGNYRETAQNIRTIESQLADVKYQEAVANNATYVNDSVIQAKRDAMDTLDARRKSRMGNPENFHKDFDKELEKAHDSLVKNAPSEAARSALRTSLQNMRLGVYEENAGWEHGRKVEIMGERLKNSGDNLASMAYRRGAEGGAFDDLIREGEASTVAASTVMKPEKIDGYNKAMRQNIAMNYLEGLTERDPLEALRRINDEDIKGQFADIGDYQKAKDVLETRALNVHKVMQEKEVLDVLKDETNFLTQSVGKNISYQDILEATQNMSTGAQDYFLNVHGYTQKEDGAPKMSEAEKLNARAQLYTAIENMKGQDLSSEDVAEFQGKIFEAMNAKILTEEQGVGYLNNIVQPLIDRKEETLSKFQVGKWNMFEENLGFSGIQKIFEDEIAVPVASGNTAADRNAAAMQTAINNGNKVKLYDYYTQSLEEQAKSYGLKVSDLDKLNKPQQQKIYSDAQAQAYKLFAIDRNPVLGTLSDLPNQTLRGGELIPGAAGKRNLKPDFTARGNFVIIEKNGHRARRYENGEIEVIQ